MFGHVSIVVHIGASFMRTLGAFFFHLILVC
jgi:hypothetical protein